MESVCHSNCRKHTPRSRLLKLTLDHRSCAVMETLMKKMQHMMDKVFGCEVAQQVGYFIEDQSVWRETTSFCKRCGEVFSGSRRRLRDSEFWEDDALYLLPFMERNSKL